MMNKLCMLTPMPTLTAVKQPLSPDHMDGDDIIISNQQITIHKFHTHLTHEQASVLTLLWFSEASGMSTWMISRSESLSVKGHFHHKWTFNQIFYLLFLQTGLFFKFYDSINQVG